MDDTDDSAHDVMFSRSTGLPAAMGKATCVAKTLVPDCVKDDLTRRSRELGMGESELIRLWIMVGLYGVDEVQTMQRQRLAMATGSVPK
jgi:hypothetical protein